MDRNAVWRKFVHEFKEMVVVSLFIIPFFLSFTAYRRLLVAGPSSAFLDYGLAIVNALVLAKVVLIGEIAGLGKRFENRPLIVSTIFKSAVFTVFALAFHVLEAVAHGLLYHETFLAALDTVVAWSREIFTRTLIFFFAFIPFFCLRELRRIIGLDEFRQLFLGKREASRVGLPLSSARSA